MRILLLILISMICMNTNAQNHPTAPPTPQAGTTSKGITYAKSQTQNSLAISIQFQVNHKADILSIIQSKIADFNGKQKVVDNAHYYQKIELESNQLKLELQSNKNSITSDFTDQKEALTSIYKAILAL